MENIDIYAHLKSIIAEQSKHLSLSRRAEGIGFAVLKLVENIENQAVMMAVANMFAQQPKE